MVSATSWPTVRVSGGSGGGVGSVPRRLSPERCCLRGIESEPTRSGTRVTRVTTTPAHRQASPQKLTSVKRPVTNLHQALASKHGPDAEGGRRVTVAPSTPTKERPTRCPNAATAGRAPAEVHTDN